MSTIGVNAEVVMQNLTAEDRDLFEQAALGIDIETFLNSHPVGRFLTKLCTLEREQAAEELIRVVGESPDNQQEILKHHRRVAMCDQFKSWLSDALEVGRDAERLLKEREAQ